MNNNGYLVISLDFELLWGIFDEVDFSEKRDYFKNTRKVIPEILKLFEENEIHCTWATVGMLFNQNWKEWEEQIPPAIPDYANKALSAYHFGKSSESKETESFCFAPDLIKEILRVKGQEIGTHTYSHYYCQEQGQRLEQFKADLEQAIKLAEKYDVHLKSLVFPRNQFKREYLEVCFELGIENVRSNPEAWYWKNPSSNSLFTKVARTGEAYNLLEKRKSYAPSEIKKVSNLPLAQKASRFLRPVEENNFLRKLKLKRIKKEMKQAARNKEIYHLWWHPHNFGDRPEESLKDLQEILNFYKTLRLKYNFQSANMQEIGAAS